MLPVSSVLTVQAKIHCFQCFSAVPGGGGAMEMAPVGSGKWEIFGI